MSIGCGPNPPGQDSASESTATNVETESETSTSTDDTDTDTDDPVKLDMGPGPQPEPQQLVIALGRGVVDGTASFAPPQQLPVTSALNLTALHDQSSSYLVLSTQQEICLASVSRQGELVELEWHDCVEVAPSLRGTYWILDIAHMDADDDGVDELVVMRPDGLLVVFRLDPASPSRLAEPIELQSSAIWQRSWGLTTGPLDDVPGDEAVAVGSEGDLDGTLDQMVILHGGDSLTTTVIDGPYGRPHVAELTGDGLPDLLIGQTIYRGTGAVNFVEVLHHISTASNLWPMDAQGDGIDDIVRPDFATINCMVPCALELRTGPFDPLPAPVAVDGTHVDTFGELLPGDLDHDGVDEIVSVGEPCSGPPRWMITSVETGTSDAVDLCEVADDCTMHLQPFGTFATELEDVDGDGNLDLAMLVAIPD
jgi:hypothetical protein